MKWDEEIDGWTLELTFESDVRIVSCIQSTYSIKVLIRNVVLRGRNQDLKSSKCF